MAIARYHSINLLIYHTGESEKSEQVKENVYGHVMKENEVKRHKRLI